MNAALHPRRSAIALVALLCTACSTPPPVLELADKTSANVGVVAARLRQLTDESDRLYGARIDNIARLHGSNATQRAAHAYDLALTRRAGQASDLEIMADLEKWSKDVDAIFASAVSAQTQWREALMVQQTRIDTRAAALQKVAEKLSGLAKEEASAARAKLLTQFARDVRDAAKKQLEDGSESAKHAKALLDEVRGAQPAASAPQ